jgi:hypothetical protein
MAETLEPARERFVIRAADRAAVLPPALLALGDIEPLPADRAFHVLRVKTGQTGEPAWKTLIGALGGGSAYPVLIDRDGAEHYPTGEVTVRFEKKPSPDALTAFAHEQELRLVRANEFAPQQFVVAPLDPSKEYLPRLVARLSAYPSVRAAWANTLSRYRRS